MDRGSKDAKVPLGRLPTLAIGFDGSPSSGLREAPHETLTNIQEASGATRSRWHSVSSSVSRGC
eukprot:1888022-Pyramimonas_sp.AAC.1